MNEEMMMTNNEVIEENVGATEAITNEQNFTAADGLVALGLAAIGYGFGVVTEKWIVPGIKKLHSKNKAKKEAKYAAKALPDQNLEAANDSNNEEEPEEE